MVVRPGQSYIMFNDPEVGVAVSDGRIMVACREILGKLPKLKSKDQKDTI